MKASLQSWRQFAWADRNQSLHQAQIHAKLYITHPRKELGLDASFALVGSSNFTIPGISKNIEMNVRIDPQAQVSELRNGLRILGAG